MRKKLFCCLIAAVLLSAVGCKGGENRSSSETTSATTTSAAAENTTTTSAADVSEPEVTEDVPEATTLPPAETEEPPVSETSETFEAPDIYAPLVSQYDNTYLGLPQKDKAYLFKSTGTTAEINDVICHCVSCHDEYEGQLYYMCDFFVTEDGSAVYRFFESTGEYVLLPEKEFFPLLDPTTQSEEEIFLNANSLYNAALGIGLAVDTSDTMTVGSITYCRVTDERFSSVMDVVEKLNMYFTQDIINGVMDTGRLRDGENGGLYAAASAADISNAEVYYELSVLSDGYAEYTAYITRPAAEGADPITEEQVYCMEHRYGVWRFTAFKAIT